MSFDSTASIPSKNISPLRDNDVLFGRGKGPQYHPGNVAFRALVDSRKADYWSENQEYGEKTQLANDIYDAIVTPASSDQPGGRFLKQADDMDAIRAEIRAGRSVSKYGGKYYIEVPRKVAVDKCKMALRQKGNPAEQREARRRKSLPTPKNTDGISGSSGPAGAIAAPADLSEIQPELMPSASASAIMGDSSVSFPMNDVSPALSGPSISIADMAGAAASAPDAAAAAAAAAAATSTTPPPIHFDSLQLDPDLLLFGEDGCGPTDQPNTQQNTINDVLVVAALEAAEAAETIGSEISHPPQQQEIGTAAAGHAAGNLDPMEQMYLPEASLGSNGTTAGTTASLDGSQETILSSHSHGHIYNHDQEQGQRRCHDAISSSVETALLSVQMYRSTVEGTAGFDANFLGRTLYDLFIEVYGDETNDQTSHSARRGNISGGGEDGVIIAEPAKRERRNSDSYQSLAMLGCPVILSNIIGCLMNQSPSEVFYSSSSEVESDLRDIMLNRTWENEASEVGDGQLCFDDNQIFGRGEELRTLFSAYDRVVREKRESRSFMAISGHSGTGKTSLVNQLLGSRLAADNASIIRCNFTEQGQSISALFQAFDDYCRIMSGGEYSVLLDRVRRDVKEALGLQAGILLGCLPNLHSLLGESVNSPTMTAETKEEELNRVLFYFIKFVEAISRPDHPTVIVFDDIQWCDESCLDLVKIILRDAEITSALFIGCYRDEEVPIDDPFGELFGDLETQASLPMSSIKLANLNAEGVNAIVSSTLRLNKRFTRPLAEILHRKTQGNPMFVRQLLLSLAGDGLLKFSAVDRCWHWSIETVSAKSIENTVSLMVGMMKTYQQSDQDALRLAALLGATFKVETLERLFILYEHGTRTDLSLIIERAISGGIIIDEGCGLLRFSHDQISQAARALTSSQEQPHAHLDVGRRLLKSVDGDISSMSPDFVATIVDQYNEGIPLISDHEEELTLAKLNLFAGEGALASASYLRAAIYFLRGCGLVIEEDWENHYNTCLRLYTFSGEAQITQGMAEGSVTAAKEVLKHGRSFSDMLPAQKALLTAYTIQGDHSEAIDHGLEVLRELGEDFPSDADARQASSKADLIKICGVLKSKSFDDIVCQSAIESDPTKILTMQVLMVVSRIAYNKDPKLMLLLVYRMISRTMSSGLTSEASFAFAALSFALCGLGKYELSSFCARVATSLLQKFNQKYSHIVLLLLNSSIFPYSQPQQACTQQLYTGYEDGMAVGAVEWALVNLSRNLQGSLFAPDPNSTLADYLKRIVKANETMVSFKHELNTVYGKLLHRAIHNLSSNDETSDPLFSLTCDEDVLSKHTPQVKSHVKRKSLTFRIWFGRLFGKYDGMKDMIDDLQAIAARNPFAPSFDTHNDYFYIGLVAFAMLRSDAADKEYWKSISSTVAEKFDEWIEIGNDWNFLSKRLMLLAESAYCENDVDVAKAAYEEAIAKAKQTSFIHEEALACELAGNFYCERGDISDGRYFLEKAIETYTRWGAHRKAIHVKLVLSNYHSP